MIGGYTRGLVGEDPTFVRTAIAERRSITHVVEAFGRVHPDKWVSIRPQVSGQIVEVAVEEGSWVEGGDLLVRLRTDRHESRLAKAQARLKQRQALVTQRRADSTDAQHRFTRQKALLKAGASFEARVEKARHALKKITAQLRAARAQVAEARARLKRVREQGENLEIQAPAEGTVSRVNVEVGEHVVGTDLVAGTQMMRIDQMNRMEFRVSVNEVEVPNIAVGDTATVTLEAYSERSLPAQVVSVAVSRRSASGRTTRQTRGSSELFSLGAGYPVRLRLQCSESRLRKRPSIQQETDPTCPTLRTGMSGKARIHTATADRAVVIPRSAVASRLDPDTTAQGDSVATDGSSTHPVVFTIRNGAARQQPVEIGLRTDRRVSIRSGLRPREEVITGPTDAVQRRLADGDPVAAGEALPPKSENE